MKDKQIKHMIIAFIVLGIISFFMAKDGILKKEFVDNKKYYVHVIVEK